MERVSAPTHRKGLLAALLTLAAGTAVHADPICDTCTTLDEVVLHLKSEMPDENSGLYTAPNAQEQADLNATVQYMLAGQCDPQDLPASLSPYYGLETIVDDGQTYCVLAPNADDDQDGTADRAWGAVIVNTDPNAKNLSIDVPHPLHDGGTPEQGIAVFKGTQARTFIMSGAHRDANNAPCDCVTGPNYSEADAAHSTEHGFHAAVEATLAHYEGLGEDYTAFQFHGMGESTCPGVDVYLTHGSSAAPQEGETIDQVRDQLESIVPPEADWQVNVPGDNPGCDLNGIGNVQGRLLNGVRPDALCQTRAHSYKGGFVHVEQTSVAREPDAYAYWIETLNAVDFANATPPKGYWITAPNGGEEWELGTQVQITWDSQSLGENVSLALYKDGSYYQSITGSTADDGAYTWTVDFDVDLDDDYTVRLKSTVDGDIRDLSDLPLSVVPGLAPPSLTVTSPNGGETWDLGADVVVTWDATNINGEVKLSVHKDGDYYKTIDNHTANTGSYEWTVPGWLEEGSDYTVRVRSVEDTSIKDYSDNTFTIEAGQNTPSITVTSPNGGETWILGEDVVVTWDATNINGEVKLSVHKDGDYYKTIDNHTANTGSYEWTVPGWLEEGSDYTVRVRSVEDTSIKDYSDNTFTIAAALQAQNYPNPFNPETTIRYTLPQAGHVEIGVYDMLGQKVAQLVSQSQNAGTHQVRFEAGHLGSGYYFYRIQAGAHTLKRQVLLLK